MNIKTNLNEEYVNFVDTTKKNKTKTFKYLEFCLLLLCYCFYFLYN